MISYLPKDRIMDFKKTKKNFLENGYCLFKSKEISKKIIKCKKNYNLNYKSFFSKSNIAKNLNLLKRFAGDMSVYDILYDKRLLEFLNFLNLKYPVQTGPILSHYVSTNSISKSFGLPFHQDYTSMCTSLNGCIVWFNINNFKKKKIHGIEIFPYNKKKIIKGKVNNKGVLKINFLDKKKTIKIYPENEVLIMSSFLPHRTIIDYTSPKSYWRLGISTRYDDLWHRILRGFRLLRYSNIAAEPALD